MSDSGVQEDGSWVPAFPGQRPPFELGHTLTVRHGARSTRLVSEEAERIRTELADRWGAWIHELDGPEVDSWLYLEAQDRMLRDWLDEHGRIDEHGRVREAANQQLRIAKQAAAARRELGMTPRSRTDMGTTAAVGKAAEEQARAALARQGAEVRRGRVIDAEPVADGPPDDGAHGGAS